MSDLTGTLTGLYYEAYADEIQDLVPDCACLTERIKFVSRAQETGNFYNVPVILSQEQGVTYAAPDDSDASVEDPIGLTMGNAKIQGCDLLVATRLGYQEAARAASDVKAFKQLTKLKVQNSMESIYKRLEISLLYGQVGLATTSGSVNASGTTTTVTFTAATFAAGMWAGLKNAKFNFYTSGGSLISSGADSVFTATTINIGNKTVLFTGTATGITALDAATAAGALAYFKNSKTADAAGIDKIITNTGSLFNIDAAVYELWKGNSVTQTGQLTMGKILKGLSQPISLGLNKKVIGLVNPNTWTDLASDLAAQRMYDGSYSKQKAENGSETIWYYGANGAIEIVPNILVKPADAFFFNEDNLERTGAQDVSWVTPGRSDQIFLQRPDKLQYEMRVYSNQAPIFYAPAQTLKISGFTNSTI